MLIHDGHDYFSHHRRLDLAPRFAANPQPAVPANLYAYDFVFIGAKGELFDGEPSSPEHWKTYGAPVYAPAAGVVTEVADGIPENTFESTATHQPANGERSDPQGFGNYVVIVDREGRYSWLLHLKPGSLSVKKGDRVQAGQRLGTVGFSGDSLFPHLHFMVTSAGQYPS